MTISHSRISRRNFLGGTASVAAALATKPAWSAAPESHDYVLHFAQPAAIWPDALPVGNGRLGAMVFGNPSLERIQLNEESIWDGEVRDRNNPKAGEAVPKIRELLFAGKIAEAEALALSDMMSIPRRMPCYQTLGDLHLDFSASGLTPETKVEDYRHELNLDTGIARTTFRHDGTTYTREVFVSAPDQVIVIRLTTNGPGELSFDARLDRPHSFSSTLTGEGNLCLSGQALPVNDNPGLPVKENQTGVRFYSEMRVVNEGGLVLNNLRNWIAVHNAKAATLYIDCATSYRYPAHSANPDRYNIGDPEVMKAAVSRNLKAASARSYEELKSRHIADHERYFRRAEIRFGADPNADVPTDVRVKRIKEGGEDIHLLPIYFQFGRYMLISSSRPGTLASNLQGIWNESVDPPWGSKYTININTEMNYWLADRANLSDCELPMFDLQDETRRSGALTAQRYYKARGFVVHHNTDIWGDSGPIDALGGGIWAMGSSWLCLHAWDHYDYTRDLRFLRERGYPLLRDNATFLLDYLVEAPAGTPYVGMLVTGPSCSPENKYKLPEGDAHNLCMGPTMDIEVTRAVLTRTIAAHQALGSSEDADLVQRAQGALKRLPPFKITHDGRLQEWPEDYTDNEPGHRHISHLFALFPDDQITPQSTPDLARASRATLDKRLGAGGGSTGWSRSWIINCFARLQDGEAAYQSILHLLRKSTRPNLFDVCGEKENSPYQIDGNLGAPSGMIEMLLQSHGGVIRLLPALPSAWPSGSFRGLRARGGVEVDLTWAKGKATQATLRATANGNIQLSPPRGQSVRGKQANGNGTIPLSLKTGETLNLLFT